MNLDEMRKNELLMINKASLSLDDVVSDILRFGYKISDVYSELSLIFEDNLKKCLE